VFYRQHPPEKFFTLPEYQSFQKAGSSQYEIHHVRTADFCRWRLSAPAASYRIIALHKGHELTGIAVDRNSAINHRDVAAVVDLMILSERASAAGALHREVERFARASGTGGVVIMAKRPDAARWFQTRCVFTAPPPFRAVKTTI
jgi:hypothetical protein